MNYNVDYHTNIEEDYIRERDAIADQQGLISFQQKWKKLFLDIAGDVTYEEFLKVKNDKDLQTEYAESLINKTTTEVDKRSTILSLLLPSLLLELCILSQEFGVSTGTVYLQIKDKIK